MVSFDPQYIHTTEPFKGTRYAITYYTLARWEELESTSQKVLKDFGFSLPITLTETVKRATSTSESEKDLPPLVPTSESEGPTKHVRFGLDSSSDSSDEDETPLLQGPVIETDGAEQIRPEEPLKEEQQGSETTNSESEDSAAADDEK